jgi:hypothetical protein
VLPVSLGPKLFHRGGGDVGQVCAAELHRQLSRVDLGQQLQIPDQAQETLRVPFDHLGALLRVRPVHALLPQDLDVTEDRRQRCPELMGDQTDELVLQPVQPEQALVLCSQLESLLGRRILCPDLRRNIAGNPEGADDPAALVPKGHLRGRHPGVRPAAVGLQFHLSHDRLARANNLLLVPDGSGGVLAAEDIEIRLPDQVLRGTAGSVRVDPARANQEEPAQQVLEVHPLPGSGQQVAHADELKFAL